jgi:hypothetical protein
MTKRQRTTIDIPDDLKREARIKALRLDKNLSQVVRELLQAWVEDEIELPEPEQESETEDTG